ncbi:MAG: hypothetical protein ABW007_07020 [Chitinophagaceae bacterium]
MAVLKVLSLAIAAITSLTNAKSNECFSDSLGSCEKVLFFTHADTIVLDQTDYQMEDNAAGCELTITNKEKLSLVKELKNPAMSFCRKGERRKAKGNDIFSSSIPNEANYFFPLDKKGYIYIERKNVVNLKEIRPDVNH